MVARIRHHQSDPSPCSFRERFERRSRHGRNGPPTCGEVKAGSGIGPASGIREYPLCARADFVLRTSSASERVARQNRSLGLRCCRGCASSAAEKSRPAV